MAVLVGVIDFKRNLEKNICKAAKFLWHRENAEFQELYLTLSSLVGERGGGGGGIIFARGKFKFKVFLNDLCYGPETLWLFLTFIRDYFAEKKVWKNIKLSEGNLLLYRGYCQKIGVRISINSLSRTHKYVCTCILRSC